jgi:prephenate dehydrogenase
VRVAVLGIGLIGGSIGLAAKRRLAGEVAGFDPDAARVDRALSIGAIDAGAASVRKAVDRAEVIFCAAPVAALPRLVAEAVEASHDDALVTDVGSTKRELVAAVGAGDGGVRFIGGHPLAGAETAGVENARADLFEGARWYLTPTPRSSGLLYDRLQRLIADLGARPQAIDAETHDRVMAAVSHLPHVLANVLVQEAATELEAEAERMPEVGPSFRDTTRVAGANPAIWGDILSANRDAVAAGIEAIRTRLAAAADLVRAGDPEAIRSWQRAALDDRRRLLEADLPGGELHELRIGVENRPGTVAEIALALGRAGVNIEDMALYPAPDMRTGAISVWIAGAEQAERAAAVVRDLGHAVSEVALGEEG